ncbi:MAG: zinc-dependent metalloprotease [Rikenellaceae bacterium]
MPVDSLRSASFTKEYGTTPSIMDYARNNYVAQPGDLEKGVRLTPPILGVYDVYAINWGYRLYPDNEKKHLDELIRSKDGDDMYRFGAQQILGTVDPTDQTEDLSNNHIKASDLCIKNLKVIIANLEKWHGEDGQPYTDLVAVYNEAIKQYLRVVMHVIPEIGGVEFKEVMQGEDPANKTVRYLSKEDQKKAMLWIVNQARTYLSWITPSYVTTRFSSQEILPNQNDLFGVSLTGALFSHTAMGRMYDSSVRLGNKDAYTVEAYVNDLMAALFEPTIKGKKLTSQDMNIEATAIDYLVKLADLQPADAKEKGKKSLVEIADENLVKIQDEVSKPTLCCSYDAQKALTNHSCDGVHSDAQSFARINMSQTIAPKAITQPLFYSKLKWVRNMYAGKKTVVDAASRNFYDYQIQRIDAILKNK